MGRGARPETTGQDAGNSRTRRKEPRGRAGQGSSGAVVCRATWRAMMEDEQRKKGGQSGLSLVCMDRAEAGPSIKI